MKQRKNNRSPSPPQRKRVFRELKTEECGCAKN